jgi:hypothetical protein
MQNSARIAGKFIESSPAREYNCCVRTGALTAMPFKYSCFISYRAAKNSLMEDIVNDLYELLSEELGMMLEKDVAQVYLDRKRLQGGDLFNPELAESLCQSVCMVSLFTPNYFSKAQPYCTQEYLKMEQLEEQRRPLLPQGSKNHGLIIPVIIRGESLFPLAIKQKRQYYNFAALKRKSNGKLSQPREYLAGIPTIAEYVTSRYLELSGRADDPCADCPGASFPSKEEALKWLEEVTAAAGGQ